MVESIEDQSIDEKTYCHIAYLEKKDKELLTRPDLIVLEFS